MLGAFTVNKISTPHNLLGLVSHILDLFHLSLPFWVRFGHGFQAFMTIVATFFLLWYHGTDVIEKRFLFMELPQKQSAWRGRALFGDNQGTDTEEGPRTQPPLQSTAIHTELQETSPPPDL